MNIVNAGARYQVYGEDVQTFKTLPAATYTVGFHPQMGFWLNIHPDLEINEDVIYGRHEARATKILKSFEISNRNFGVILSGKKGIGKSLLSRMIAKKSIEKGLPVIIVDTAIPGISDFLSSIDQEVVIIFDEFEKVFSAGGEDHRDPQVELLSLFDGIDNGKKLFIITCNETKQLNEYLINRPGRFHYHFEITPPSSDEVAQYMRDKLGSGYEEEVEKVAKLSQISDITFDALRAITFELQQGYSIEDTLADLNINYEKGSSYDVTVRLSNGWILSTYSARIDLYSKDRDSVGFYHDKMRLYINFIPNDITLENGVLSLPLNKVNLSLPWDAFEAEAAGNDDKMEALQKKFLDEVKIESAVFTKVNISSVSKYLV